MIIPAGYKWITGVVLNRQHTEQYNTLSAEIDTWIEAVGEIHPKVQELQNARARWLNIVFSVY